MSEKLETCYNLSNLSYEEKSKIYSNIFSLGFFGENMNDKLILVSLLSLTYKRMLEKDASITPLKILLKITNQKEDNSIFFNMLESLSLLVEEMSYGVKEIDTCGLKNSNEVINKIKELLNKWIPF